MNAILFVFSVVTFFTFWWLSDPLGSTIRRATIFKRILILTVLCAPFNIDGVIVTPLGSAKHDGLIVSLFSLYQNGRNTFAVFGSLYQQAERDTAVLFGLAGCQQAGRTAVIGYGIAGCQHGNKHAAMVFGFVGHQRGGKETRTLALLHSELGEGEKDPPK